MRDRCIAARRPDRAWCIVAIAMEKENRPQAPRRRRLKADSRNLSSVCVWTSRKPEGAD